MLRLLKLFNGFLKVIFYLACRLRDDKDDFLITPDVLILFISSLVT